jgi:hypothetical protein
MTYENTLFMLQKSLVMDYQKLTEKNEDGFITRIIGFNLFDEVNEVEYTQCNQRNVKIQLLALKNIIRSINGVIYLNITKEFVNKDFLNLLKYFSDYIFEFSNFLYESDKVEGYDGILKINKTPRVCCLKTIKMETDLYGIRKDKRKIIIERIDIGVEIDRNTKIKTKDVEKAKTENNLDF